MNEVNAITISVQIAERLRMDIITGYYKQRERITIKDVADRFNVSYMPVREAFQTLKGEKFIEHIPHKGAIVVADNKKYVRDTLEMHATMQAEYTSRICREDIPETLLNEIKDCYKEIEKFESPNDPLFLTLNEKFHGLFLKTCKNEKVLEQFNEYYNLFRSLRAHYNSPVSRLQLVKSDHEEIMAALLARDADRLRTAVYNHKMQSIESTLSIMD